MSTLTIRLPDDKLVCLRQLAKHRDISVDKLVEELATICIAEFDSETRFRALAARGSAKEDMAILDNREYVTDPNTGLRVTKALEDEEPVTTETIKAILEDHP